MAEIKKENIVIPLERNFLQVAKINSQQEKPAIPNRKTRTHFEDTDKTFFHLFKLDESLMSLRI